MRARLASPAENVPSAAGTAPRRRPAWLRNRGRPPLALRPPTSRSPHPQNLASAAKRADPLRGDEVALLIEQPDRLVERRQRLVFPAEEAERLAPIRVHACPGRTGNPSGPLGRRPRRWSPGPSQRLPTSPRASRARRAQRPLDLVAVLGGEGRRLSSVLVPPHRVATLPQERREVRPGVAEIGQRSRGFLDEVAGAAPPRRRASRRRRRPLRSGGRTTSGPYRGRRTGTGPSPSRAASNSPSRARRCASAWHMSASTSRLPEYSSIVRSARAMPSETGVGPLTSAAVRFPRASCSS